MRQKLILLLTAFVAFSAAADVFEYDGIKYESFTENGVKKARTASKNLYLFEFDWGAPQFQLSTDPNNAWAQGDLLGPNYDENKTFVEIPAKVIDNNNEELEVVEIGDFSFAGKKDNYSESQSSLSYIKLPATVKVIGTGAFFGVKNLVSVDFGGVNTIKECAFFECKLDEKFELPGSVTKIEKAAFFKSSIPTLKLTGNIEIDDYAFYGAGIKNLELNIDLDKLGKDIFKECSALETLTIGDNVKSIPENAFSGFKSLTNIVWGPNLTTIGARAFYGCSGIEELNLPDSVTYIGDSAFQECTGITKLELGQNVKTIGNNAFASCRNLTSFTLNSTLESMGQNVFSDCTQFTNLTIGANVKSIPDYAFANCDKIKNLVINATLENLNSNVFSNCNQMQTVTFGETVKSIPDGAFKGLTMIKNVNLSNSIEWIGESAFENCSGLEQIDFGLNSSLKDIRDSAFKGCGALHNIEFPESLIWIGNSAFENCANLNEIIFGNNLKSIGDYAFKGCNIHGRTEDDKDALEIPSSVRRIGKHAFEGILNFNSHKVVFDEGLEEIDESCFKDAFIFELELPSTMKRIGSKAFDLKPAISVMFDIYSYAQEPPYLEDPDVFADWIYEYVCLHVPLGKADLYRSKGWGYEKFGCIIDDLIAPESPMAELVDYIFMVPGEIVDLNKYLNKSDFSVEKMSWEIVPEENNKDIISLSKNDNTGVVSVEALKFGQAIIKGYTENLVRDENNQDFHPSTTATAAVIVFVCPTVTVVYNDEGVMDKFNASAAANAYAAKPRMIKAGDYQTETTLSELTNKYATYEYRVVYNSLPKFEVAPASNVTVEKLDRGKLETDKDGNLLYDGDTIIMETVKDNGEVINEDRVVDTDIQDNFDRLVPLDPITENRVLEVYPTMNMDALSGVENVEVGDGITVTVEGNTITVNGAQPDDIVDLYDVNGQKIYSSATKSFQIYRSGVFIATVGDAAFKIAVNY